MLKTATGTGALPSQVPAGRPMAVWGGRTGQRAFEFHIMNPLQLAMKEWEDKTTPQHKERKGGKKIRIQEFRKYGEAIAWLELDSKHIEIKKIEKLSCKGRGAGTALIEFLKSLADKYQVRLFGGVVAYDLEPPISNCPTLSQAQLEDWYQKRGFQLRRIPDSDIVLIWYPDLPKTASDACQPIETK